VTALHRASRAQVEGTRMLVRFAEPLEQTAPRRRASSTLRDQTPHCRSARLRRMSESLLFTTPAMSGTLLGARPRRIDAACRSALVRALRAPRSGLRGGRYRRCRRVELYDTDTTRRDGHRGHPADPACPMLTSAWRCARRYVHWAPRARTSDTAMVPRCAMAELSHDWHGWPRAPRLAERHRRTAMQAERCCSMPRRSALASAARWLR
jgi:hypothetical protein